MTWFKTCDDFPDNEKTRSLVEGPCRGDCIALWLFSGCWSSRHLKNGFVSRGVIASFGFHPEAASELVRVGLWEIRASGYQFHDWADYQPSASRVEERRRQAADRKAQQRARLSTAKQKRSSVDQLDLADVGMSRVDSATCGHVTQPVTHESRMCLAEAARDRDLGSPSSSSEILTLEKELTVNRTRATELTVDAPRETGTFRAPVGEPPGWLNLDESFEVMKPLVPTPDRSARPTQSTEYRKLFPEIFNAWNASCERPTTDMVNFITGRTHETDFCTLITLTERFASQLDREFGGTAGHDRKEVFASVCETFFWAQSKKVRPAYNAVRFLVADWKTHADSVLDGMRQNVRGAA